MKMEMQRDNEPLRMEMEMKMNDMILESQQRMVMALSSNNIFLASNTNRKLRMKDFVF